MTGLCAALLAGSLAWQLPGAGAFELVWTHSIEKVEWRETWAPAGDGLHLVTVRVKGSGAGMEPPEGARLVDGWWRAEPEGVVYPALTLARSGAVPDYRLCLAGDCRPLSGWLPGLPETGALILSPC